MSHVWFQRLLTLYFRQSPHQIFAWTLWVGNTDVQWHCRYHLTRQHYLFLSQMKNHSFTDRHERIRLEEPSGEHPVHACTCTHTHTHILPVQRGVNYSTLLRTLPSWVFKISKDGDFTTTVCFRFMLEFCQELLVHPHRPLAAFDWYPACWDGPLLSLAGRWYLKINRCSWSPLLSRMVSHGILLSRRLKCPKTALLKSTAVILFFASPLPFRILNSTVEGAAATVASGMIYANNLIILGG